MVQLVVLLGRMDLPELWRAPPAERLVEVQDRGVSEVGHPRHGLQKPEALHGPVLEDDIDEPTEEVVGCAHRCRRGHLWACALAREDGLIAQHEVGYEAGYLPPRARVAGGAQHLLPLPLEVLDPQLQRRHWSVLVGVALPDSAWRELRDVCEAHALIATTALAGVLLRDVVSDETCQAGQSADCGGHGSLLDLNRRPLFQSHNTGGDGLLVLLSYLNGLVAQATYCCSTSRKRFCSFVLLDNLGGLAADVRQQ
mmetsp:Transcript_46703/g.117568  ORF Transcript_46703/g.117568 Transcript_46703/m.117568 type:complete len:254 (-) Transcript_46703:698-1459(-)